MRILQDKLQDPEFVNKVRDKTFRVNVGPLTWFGYRAFTVFCQLEGRPTTS